ncbi:MAG: YegP family protein [Sphingomonadaceae bacterium]
MRFEIHQEGVTRLTGLRNAGGDWRWELFDDGGLMVARGEGYRTRGDCRHAVDVLKATDADTQVIDRI